MNEILKIDTPLFFYYKCRNKIIFVLKIFAGVFCENTFCDTITCRNGGTCLNGNGSWSCDCSEEFTGVLCESLVEDCGVTRCSGHGFCDVIDSKKCRCFDGWTGKKNQIAIK